VNASLRWRGIPFSGVLLFAALLAAWEGSVRFGIVTSANWPAFSDVMGALVRGLHDGTLEPVIGSTLWRMVQGYVIGSVLGIAIGLTIALVEPVRLTLEPALELLRPIPIIALIPPLIFLLGLGDPLKIFCVAAASFFPVVLNTAAGVIAVDPIYRQVALTFGIPPGVALRTVIVPAALPFITAGLRTSLAIAITVAVVAEMLAGQQGVGYYLLSMQFALRAPEMYAAIVLLAIVAYALNWAFVAWESRVIRWSRTSAVQSDAA
jgi:ABC-type nitrate/sulfonate/bicarbonate transport system permease component